MKFLDTLSRFLSYLPMEPKRRTFRLEVPAVDIELLTIKDFVQRVCDAAGCNPKEASGIKLAIDEACSNIIRHAYEGRHDGKISLEMGIGFIDLKIKIVDFGKSFDFQNIQVPDLNHYVDIGKKGGLGIWLIKKVMTRVSYRSFPGRNELLLYRRLAKAPPKTTALKKGSISISTKFTVGSGVLISFLILSAYFFLAYRQESFVTKQQLEKVTLLAQTVASEAGAPVVNKSDLELDRLIHEVLKEDKAKIFDYVFILGPDAKFLAHSDLTQLFKSYQPPAGLKISREPGVKNFKLKSGGDSITEYVVPVFYRGEWVGEVHMGVKDEAVEQQMDRVKADYRRLVFFIFLISVTGLYFLSRIVISPFQKILQGIHSISTGDLNTKMDVDSQDEFGQLAGVFNEMTARIQDSQKGMVEQERLQKEMQVAQEIQHTLLPKEFPEIEGYEIGATYRAAKEVGGDYYDFFWVDPTTLGIVVADVSGKGVPGSMVMTMIRTAMRLEARGNKSASDVLGKVNGHVTSDMKKGMFVTMFYIVLDSRNRSINFASAGHNPMVLYRGKTKEVYFLKPKGFPVGIDLPEEDMFTKNMDLQKVSLQKNDMLVIYTDGITEAMNVKSEQFGEAKLVEVIKENAHLTPSEFVEKLNESIAQFTRGAEQNDDITVVAIKEKMQAENVVFNFRKKLIALVEKKGLSVAEACRKMNISTNTYYRYKKIFDEKGHAGLKPVKSKKRDDVRELTIGQKEAVLELVKKHPEFGPARLTEALGKTTNPPVKVDQRVVFDFLKRKNLGSVKERELFSVNEVDTV